MEIDVKYENLKDRAEKVKENEGSGLRMLHDNFDPDWKRGDEPHGVMIFTDEPSPLVKTEPTRDYGKEIDDLKAEIELLKAEKL